MYVTPYMLQTGYYISSEDNIASTFQLLNLLQLKIELNTDIDFTAL